MARRAVLLDRDGTINVERNYLHRVEDVAWTPGAPEAIAQLNAAGWIVAVVTNQAGIARGLYDEAALLRLHAFMEQELARFGAHIDAWRWCPHHPDFGPPCACRKPAPGMLLDLAASYDLALDQSWMVGDNASDIEAGQRAGCRTMLVRTGYGAATAHNTAIMPDLVADDLQAAVALILAHK